MKNNVLPENRVHANVGDQVTDAWWLLRNERTGYYQSFAQEPTSCNLSPTRLCQSPVVVRPNKLHK